jgi:hypothetical protein
MLNSPVALHPNCDGLPGDWSCDAAVAELPADLLGEGAGGAAGEGKVAEAAG